MHSFLDRVRFAVMLVILNGVIAASINRHQGPASDDHVVISEKEFDARSKENVERWVSAHIIPVRYWYFNALYSHAYIFL